MNYLGITPSSLINGEGIRTVLWVSGCEHRCKGCQNPGTWDKNGGKEFDNEAMNKLLKALSRPVIDGLTFSGGDPLHLENRQKVTEIAKEVKERFPNKSIWLYTGYVYKDIKNLEILKYLDVLVDGPFIENLADKDYKYAGSTNQRIIRIEGNNLKIVQANPDIRKLVVENGGYCPCTVVKNDDTKCMCKEFREQDTPGECHCGLYRKELRDI